MKIFILLSVFFVQQAFSQAIDPMRVNPVKSFALGIIEEIHSVQLAENRVLNIYFPEGYDQKDTTRYPVVYLLDGSADEDFIHIVGLFQFNNFPWINRVPRSIVVGIASVDRKRDFTFPTSIESDQKRNPTAGHSANFIAFIEKELQPFVNRNYKATDERTLIGQSLGGLLATEILFRKPALFSRYIIVSPSLWWDDASLLKQRSEILKPGYDRRTDIYIGVGKEGLAPGDSPHVMEVDANLLADKLIAAGNKNLRVYFDYLPDEDHATVSHQAVFNALRLLYPAVN
ncbi:MAG: alpha/beta hydrolase [Chitinophagaceae bacterium]|nr:alpha/beta hydrolase [Chitinophagaceae bacterium]